MKEILLDVELITEIHAQGPKEQTQFGFLTTKKLLQLLHCGVITYYQHRDFSLTVKRFFENSANCELNFPVEEALINNINIKFQ